MIDFKKELQNYKPVKTMAELDLNATAADTLDVNDYLSYIFNESRIMSDNSETYRKQDRR